MKVIVIPYLITFLVSCSNRNKLPADECNKFRINTSLYEELLTYQKQNPIPTFKKGDKNLPPLPQESLKYIYEITFLKEKDSTITITLRPDGVYFNGVEGVNKVYGVYEDSCIKPTYVIDNYQIGEKFIESVKTKDLENYIYNNSNNVDIIYSLYIYNLVENKLVFKEKINGYQD